MANASTQSSAPGRLSKGAPAWSAAAAGLLLGAAIAVFGAYLIGWSSMPGALGVALVIFGIMEGLVGFYTLRRVRVAWAFALSMNATAFVVTLFGAPKIRDAAEIASAAAAVPCLVFGVLTLLLALSSDDF